MIVSQSVTGVKKQRKHNSDFKKQVKMKGWQLRLKELTEEKYQSMKTH